MFVSDIIDDLKSSDVLGTCELVTCFRRLSDAVKLITNQGILDPQIGEMDLCVCDGCVTLPSEIDQVLAVNSAGMPTLIRDQWFQYHINGTGSQAYTPFNYTDVVSNNVPTFRDPSAPVALVAQIESAVDSNKKLRVFGWDVDGKRIYTEGSDGTLQDGFLVPTVYGFSQPNPAAPLVARIDRVHKDITNGFVRLLAVNEDGSPHTLIGYYRPEESVPAYVRLQTSARNWLRIKYRRRDVEVRSVNDWINIENREAIIMAVKAVNSRRKNNLDLARAQESEAIRLINNEAEAKRPPGLNSPQIIFNEYPTSDGDRLFY
jgi:hypothetical protein